MRKLFCILCLMPSLAMAQTTTQKVLYMKVERSMGTTTARLEGKEDFLGPIYHTDTQKLFINGAYRSLSNIKGIRFEIKTEEVADGIVQVQEEGTEDSASRTVFDLSGRPVEERSLQRGIYIIGQKKYIKK